MTESISPAGALLSHETAFEAARGYRGLDEISRACDALVERGARQRIAGYSIEGRPLRVLEIGSPDARTVAVALAGIHAMEWIGVEVLIETLGRLVDEPPTDLRIVAFPVVNVDGFARCEQDLREGRRRFRRGNARGIDLNRNWPTFFRQRTPLGTLLPWVFRSGPAARSEPEIDGVLRVLDQCVNDGARIARALSLHSFGRRVLFPYGGRWREPREVAVHRTAAKSFVDRAADRYREVQSARWVPGAFAYGMEIDHLHEAFGATALLVECSSGGLEWPDPVTWSLPFAWFNPRDPRADVATLAPPVESFLRGAL